MFLFCLFCFGVIFPIYCCFFFSSRRRHTRCGRDWSSDVCFPICHDRSSKSARGSDTRVSGRALNSEGSVKGNVSTSFQLPLPPGLKRKNSLSPIAKTRTSVETSLISGLRRKEHPTSVVCAPCRISLLQSPGESPLLSRSAFIVGTQRSSIQFCQRSLQSANQR